MRTDIVNDKQAALDANFAGYNNGRHLLIELEQETTTLSVKTPDGKLVTFAFCERPNRQGHQCVDIINHSMPKNESSCPLQRAAFLGQGPTNAVTQETDEQPTTVVVLSIPE